VRVAGVVRGLITTVAVSSALLTGCATNIDGRAVAAEATAARAAADDSQCTKVDAPMTDVDPAPGPPDDSEPTMRIPQPDGWERATELDSEMIRFTMHNTQLGNDRLAAAAVITIESHRGEIKADDFFDQSRQGLIQSFGGEGLTYDDHTLCGLPAQTIHYTLPAQMAAGQAVPATVVVVVAFSGNTTYGIALTMQSPRSDAPAYNRDLETITTGFQVLAPDAGPR
jgi:hypothetical protein